MADCLPILVYDRHGGAFALLHGGQTLREAPAGRACLDLPAANAILPELARVQELYAAADCTACTAELSSFRRERPGFGCLAAFIGAIRR